VEFSSADEPTRVAYGTVFIGLAIKLESPPQRACEPEPAHRRGRSSYRCQHHPTRPDLQDEPATRSTGSEERPTFLGGSDERPSTAGADEGEISFT